MSEWRELQPHEFIDVRRTSRKPCAECKKWREAAEKIQTEYGDLFNECERLRAENARLSELVDGLEKQLDYLTGNRE